MGRIKLEEYIDVIYICNDTPEKIEEDLKKAEEESKKLTDWPAM